MSTATIYVSVEDAHRALDALAEKIAVKSIERDLAVTEARAALLERVQPTVGDVEEFVRKLKADFAQISTSAPAAPPVPKQGST